MHKMRITKKRRIDTTRVLLLYFVRWVFIRFSLCIPSANLIPNLNSTELRADLGIWRPVISKTSNVNSIDFAGRRKMFGGKEWNFFLKVESDVLKAFLKMDSFALSPKNLSLSFLQLSAFKTFSAFQLSMRWLLGRGPKEGRCHYFWHFDWFLA